MDKLTERLEQLAELQKKSLAPLQHLGGNAFAAFERVARKNHELMGDMVEYAVTQSRGSLEQRSPQALYEYQMAEAKAFAERMGARAAEYAALAEEMRAGVTPPGGPSARRAPKAASTAPSAAADGNASAVPSKPASRDDDGQAAPKRAAAKKSASAPSRKTSSRKSASAGTPAKKTSSKKRASGKKVSSKKASAKKTSAARTNARKAGSKKAGSKKRATRSRSAS